jgi:hemerythrin-like domain-containing protein
VTPGRFKEISMNRSPAAVLEAEHRYIQKVVGGIALHVDAIESGQPPDIGLLGEVEEFMRVFADECHHGKEEALLFPALERKGVPPGGCPLGALKHEHIAGKALVTELAKAVTDSRTGVDVPTEALVACLQGLVALYPTHIWKEDYLLFPMTGKVLSEEEQAGLLVEFDAADEQIGIARYHRFEEWSAALAAKAL